jgi:hypothetical protein
LICPTTHTQLNFIQHSANNFKIAAQPPPPLTAFFHKQNKHKPDDDTTTPPIFSSATFEEMLKIAQTFTISGSN